MAVAAARIGVQVAGGEVRWPPAPTSAGPGAAGPPGASSADMRMALGDRPVPDARRAAQAATGGAHRAAARQVHGRRSRAAGRSPPGCTAPSCPPDPRPPPRPGSASPPAPWAAGRARASARAVRRRPAPRRGPPPVASTCASRTGPARRPRSHAPTATARSSPAGPRCPVAGVEHVVDQPVVVLAEAGHRVGHRADRERAAAARRPGTPRLLGQRPGPVGHRLARAHLEHRHAHVDPSRERVARSGTRSSTNRARSASAARAGPRVAGGGRGLRLHAARPGPRARRAPPPPAGTPPRCRRRARPPAPKRACRADRPASAAGGGAGQLALERRVPDHRVESLRRRLRARPPGPRPARRPDDVAGPRARAAGPQRDRCLGHRGGQRVDVGAPQEVPGDRRPGDPSATSRSAAASSTAPAPQLGSTTAGASRTGQARRTTSSARSARGVVRPSAALVIGERALHGGDQRTRRVRAGDGLRLGTTARLASTAAVASGRSMPAPAARPAAWRANACARRSTATSGPGDDGPGHGDERGGVEVDRAVAPVHIHPAACGRDLGGGGRRRPGSRAAAAGGLPRPRPTRPLRVRPPEGTTTLPGTEVGNVRATQNPTRPGSATTRPPSGSSAARVRARCAAGGGEAVDAYSGPQAAASSVYSAGRSSVPSGQRRAVRGVGQLEPGRCRRPRLGPPRAGWSPRAGPARWSPAPRRHPGRPARSRAPAGRPCRSGPGRPTRRRPWPPTC